MKINGQGALRSRTTAKQMSPSTSIVQRLTQREHSGCNLRVLVHQHYGYRMHYTWDGAFGNRSIERRFRSHDAVLDFCTTVSIGTFEGLCSCISTREGFFNGHLGTMIDLMYTKTSICNKATGNPGVLLPIPTWLDGPWSTVCQEREWLETDAGNVKCMCNITLVEVMLYK
jgi:hypothetical protein